MSKLESIRFSSKHFHSFILYKNEYIQKNTCIIFKQARSVIYAADSSFFSLITNVLRRNAIKVLTSLIVDMYPRETLSAPTGSPPTKSISPHL